MTAIANSFIKVMQKKMASKNILIVEDERIVALDIKSSLESLGYTVNAIANSGEAALKELAKNPPDLVLMDIQLKGVMDGVETAEKIRCSFNIPVIYLTANADINTLQRAKVTEPFGYILKPFEEKQLNISIEMAIYKHQKERQLKASEQWFATTLTEATDYVRSLLPEPLAGPVTTEALFVPSTQLGGDCFDYYWLDDDNLAIYLLDVSGHGIGSALLSVSVLNVLRSQSLPSTNFCQPSQVLRALNRAFQMINHGERYFTIWYGVYNQSAHQLVYASAGHPPAVLLSGRSQATPQVKLLGTPGLPLGILADNDFGDHYCEIQENSTLYIFSDGTYEIHRPDGTIWGFEAFIDLLADFHKTNTYHPDSVLHQMRTLTSKDTFEDDLSLLKVNFS